MKDKLKEKLAEEEVVLKEEIAKAETKIKPNDKIKVIAQTAYIRPLASHLIPSMGKATFGKEFDVVAKVSGTSVAGSDIWYKIAGVNGEGYIHASYVMEI